MMVNSATDLADICAAHEAVFPPGCLKPHASAERLRFAETELKAQGVDPTKTVCWFVGMFGQTYDLATVIDAAREQDALGTKELQFVLCGDGELREEWISRSEERFAADIVYQEMHDYILRIARQ